MNPLIIITFAFLTTYISASGIGTYVDGCGGAVIKGPAGSIQSKEILGTISHGVTHGGITSYGTGSYGRTYVAPIGHGIAAYGPAISNGIHVYGGSHVRLVGPGLGGYGSYGGPTGHGLDGYASHGTVPAVIAAPQTHAVVTGTQTNTVITGSKTHAVITGPVATAEIREPQSHTILTEPVVEEVAAGHGILGQRIGYGYGLGHAGIVGGGYGYGTVLGHGAVISNGEGYVSAGHEGAIVKGPRTVPALINGPSGKVYAEGLWGPTTRGINGYAHGW